MDVVALLREDREAGAAAIFTACVRLVRLDRPKFDIPRDLIDDVANVAALRVIVKLSAPPPVELRVKPLGALCRVVVANVAREVRRGEERARRIASPSFQRYTPTLKERLACIPESELAWLGDRDLRIVEGLRSGATERAVATVVGVSHATVRRSAQHVAHLVFGTTLKARRLPPHDAEWAAAVLTLPGATVSAYQRQVLERVAQRQTQRSIGVALGRKPKAIQQTLVRLGRRFPRSLSGATIKE